MECRYCQSANSEEDHRCRRCGRRLRVGPAYTGAAATAPVLEYQSEPAPRRDRQPLSRIETHAPPEPSAPRRAPNYQPSLFSSRELPRVVPFESIAPNVQHAPRKSQPSAPRQRARRVIPGQQALDFTHVMRAKQADGVIYCDAPVAVPAHRAMAAAVDASIVVLALTLFFGIVFRVAGGISVLNIKTAPIFFGMAAAVVLFYRMLWCLANGDSAGQRWAHLRLVNFDGQRPTRTQRFYRLASGLLSLMAAGIGLLWSLVDEETLTWHDHISKTFPTPVN